ncbi:MAG: Maf family protein [Candidatus Eremiobacteraeota bacterium]|nr:Maf family protein [Candidatus Eremiobacteraeota bacterium]
MNIVLASSSPRRSELLATIGLSFKVLEPNAREVGDAPGSAPLSLSPKEIAKTNALLKARKVSPMVNGDAVIVGADTIVVLQGELLGKPRSCREACQMLTRLSGKTHKVITGVAVLNTHTGKEVLGSEETDVTFRRLSAKEIEGYVASGEPLDKAGAYGIQGKGALLVQRVKGCYFNVVGLPLVRMVRLMRASGFHFSLEGEGWRGGIDE